MASLAPDSPAGSWLCTWAREPATFVAWSFHGRSRERTSTSSRGGGDSRASGAPSSQSRKTLGRAGTEARRSWLLTRASRRRDSARAAASQGLHRAARPALRRPAGHSKPCAVAASWRGGLGTLARSDNDSASRTTQEPALDRRFERGLGRRDPRYEPAALRLRVWAALFAASVRLFPSGRRLVSAATVFKFSIVRTRSLDCLPGLVLRVSSVTACATFLRRPAARSA